MHSRPCQTPLSLFEWQRRRDWGHSTAVEGVDSSRKVVGEDTTLEEVEGVPRTGWVEGHTDWVEGLHMEFLAGDMVVAGDTQIDCILVVEEGILAGREGDIAGHKHRVVGVHHTGNIPVEEPRMADPEVAPVEEDNHLEDPDNTT